MTEEKTLAELEAELKELTAKKVSAMKEEFKLQEEEEAKKIADQKAEDDKIAFNDNVTAILESYGIKPQVEGAGEGEPGNDGNDDNGQPPELHENVVFSQHLAKMWDLPAFGSYEDIAQQYVDHGTAAFIEFPLDCPLTSRATWHAECFADTIWLATLCKSDFLGKNITVRGLDFTKGCGGVIQLRTINIPSPSSDFGIMKPCECMTCVSNLLETHTMTMEQYGDYRILCDMDAFTVGDKLKPAIMRTMSVRAAERIDYAIWYALWQATPTYTATLDTDCAGAKTYGRDTCCDYGTNLFEKIIDLEADMRNAGYFDLRDPVLIISPDVAVHLKYRSGISTPMYWYNNIEMEGNKIAKIGNISVIESCHASDCSATPGVVQAVLIDPERAIGEAWGKRPTFKTDPDPIECEQLKIVLTMWADFAVLESGAVGHILNGT